MSKQEILIAPSILSADFCHLGDAMEHIYHAGADWAHVDVMDGHFVPNLTLGVPFVQQASASCKLPLDVHLMIDNPLEELPWFLSSKPYMVTVHIEALRDEDSQIKAVHLIHNAGCHAGIAINPETSIESVYPTLEMWDMVLIMSVHPGFSGQSYIEGSEAKVSALRDLCSKKRHDLAFSGRSEECDIHPLIEIDGGMNVQTAQRVCASGANVIVSGSTIFSAPDTKKAISQLRDVSEKAYQRA